MSPSWNVRVSGNPCPYLSLGEALRSLALVLYAHAFLLAFIRAAIYFARHAEGEICRLGLGLVEVYHLPRGYMLKIVHSSMNIREATRDDFEQI